MRSAIDVSAVRLVVSCRMARETHAAEKLDLLRRLQRRYVEARLPRESETRIEQSFNEQLFAKVFGYRTLFSHDALPFHLRPKNYASGVHRYDDFSLGQFWGDERDVVKATAEFKDPGADLDTPQGDRSDNVSPVDQAFRAARGFPACEWVIVSNFRELRLYAITSPAKSLAVVDLHEVRSRKQLAHVCAHFDRQALLGSGKKADMSIALDPNHPSALPATENAFRLVCTFTPREEFELFLSGIYDALRETAVQVIKVERDKWDRPTKFPAKLEDGWCAIDMEAARLAVSAEGQVRCSIRHGRASGTGQINPDAGFWTISSDISEFLHIVRHLYGSVNRDVSGLVSFELREIRGWQIYFGAQHLLKKNDATNAGVADQDDVFSGDVRWTMTTDAARVAADCMGELAIHFRNDDGSRVRFEHPALARHFDAGNEHR